MTTCETKQTPVCIGTKVYVYDCYRGQKSPLTLKGHLSAWDEYQVTGETKVSWIVRRGQTEYTEFKIEKKTLRSRGDERIAWSKDEIVAQWNDDQFRYYHAPEIVHAVRHADLETIKQVAGIVGYTKHLENTNDHAYRERKKVST